MGVERVPLRVSHERRSLRLRGFDYSRPGVYFVTIRARHDGPMFGELVATHMRLGQYGRIVTACWLEIPKHFPHVTLGTRVVMPDHMHGIIVINERADADNVGAQHAAPLQLQHGGRLQQDARLSQTALRAHAIRASTTVARGSLGAIVRAFKSAVTKQINELRRTPGKPVWQRNYYDRIIRDDGELHRVRRYILSNPNRCTDASKPLARRASETGHSPFSTPRMSRSS